MLPVMQSIDGEELEYVSIACSLSELRRRPRIRKLSCAKWGAPQLTKADPTGRPVSGLAEDALLPADVVF